MTDAQDDDACRDEVVFLPDVMCPTCSSRSVVVEIEVDQVPILSCTACGHSSHPAD